MTDINTDIVRRIDDLGRLIIPSNVRRQLRIHEGDAFEIIATDNGILFRRNPFPTALARDIGDAAAAMAEVFPTGRFYALDGSGHPYGTANVLSPKVEAAVDTARTGDNVSTIDEDKNIVMMVPVIVEAKVQGILVTITPPCDDVSSIWMTMQAMARYIQKLPA